MIGVIGFGKMGSSLAKSFANSGTAKNEIICSDINNEAIKKEGFVAAADSSEVAEKSEVIFICVKPGTIGTVLEEIKNKIDQKIIVSIAAGIKISSMKKIIGEKKIVRVMPNIAAIVGEGANAFTSINLDENEKQKIKKLLDNFGVSIEVDEQHFDIVTGLSGSGPAFVAYFLETMEETAIKHGLGKKEAHILGLQALFGTAKLLKTGLTTQELIEMVSSPNGTTIAGRKVLENGEFKKIIEETLTKAKERSEELGKNEE